jgi:hypothetical protein
LNLNLKKKVVASGAYSTDVLASGAFNPFPGKVDRTRCIK